MSEQLTTTRTPEVIAAEVRMYAQNILTGYLEIGRRFKEAKSLLPHGEFGDWVENQCGFKRSSANNYMRLFEEYGAEQGSLFGTELKSQTFGNLSYSQALTMLSLPAEEREEFVKSHDMESMSIRQLKEEIEEWKEKNAVLERELLDSDKEFENLEKELAGAKNEIRRLKNRPVEVAVAEPDPAVIEDAVNKALAEAQESHNKELQGVKNDFAQKVRELEAAKTARSAAEKAAKKAEQEKQKAEAMRNSEAAKAEDAERRAVEAEKRAAEAEAKGGSERIEELEAETERLRKQLAMSGEAMALFKERFFQWQTDWGKMREALFKLDDETAGKSKQAVAAQIKRWAAEMEVS